MASSKHIDYTAHECDTLANVMKVARSLAGVSLRQYAKRIQVSPATLSRIENGLGCDLSTLAQIRRATKIKYSVLLGEQSHQGPGGL